MEYIQAIGNNITMLVSVIGYNPINKRKKIYTFRGRLFDSKYTERNKISYKINN